MEIIQNDKFKEKVELFESRNIIRELFRLIYLNVKEYFVVICPL